MTAKKRREPTTADLLNQMTKIMALSTARIVDIEKTLARIAKIITGAPDEEETPDLGDEVGVQKRGKRR